MIEVVCGVLIQNATCLIAKRNYGSAKGMYEFPGGKVEHNESKQQALVREFQEELGIQIEDVRFLEESTDVQEEEIHLTCFTCTSKHTHLSYRVHSEFVWTTPDHIYDYNFFPSDKILVQRLKEKWSCLIEQTK